MAASRQHYERAFEAYLRRARLPYVLVDDAKRAILPKGAAIGLVGEDGRTRRLKSFDAVVYGPERHALIEVKGRRVDLRRGGSGRRECWTTTEDIRSLTIWQRLFGEPFEAVLVFMHWLEGPVPRAGHRDLLHHGGRVYTHRAVRVSTYSAEMRVRSPKWGTVDLPAGVFERVGLSMGDLLAGFAGQLGERGASAADGLEAEAEAKPAPVHTSVSASVPASFPAPARRPDRAPAGLASGNRA